jgi:DNA-binding transcriptional ArsR family regulator
MSALPAADRPPQLDDVARLIAEPRRLRMLWALGDGCAYTATELAGVAELAPSAASNHLARLVDAGVVGLRVQGRHRYFALQREDVARAVEALGAVTLQAVDGRALPEIGVPRRLPRPALRFARRCYGHLAGELGVALWDRCVLHGLLREQASVSARGWQLTRRGTAAMQRVLAASEAAGRDAARQEAAKLEVRPCLDWTERRWHLGGSLGRALLAGLLRDGVLLAAGGGRNTSRGGSRVLHPHPQRWSSWLAALQ